MSIAGGSARDGNVVVVAGAGLGLNHPAGDQAHFTYRTIGGDVDIVARLRSVDSHPLASAGIMIRESLHPEASYAALSWSSARGVGFSRRLARGWIPIETSGSQPASWFKLERRGELVSAFTSLDGVRWEFVGSNDVSLKAAIHVGLMTWSHQSGTLATAVFDSVDVQTLDARPAPTPDVTAASPPIPAFPPQQPPASAPAPEPDQALRYLLFEPSPDHMTTVTSYVFEIALAGAMGTTVLQHNIGKPAVVNGECRVDVGALLALLPSGSYVALVRAQNSVGLSPPGVSAVFSR